MKGIYQVGNDVIFHDPTPDFIPTFREIDPTFTIQSVQPAAGFIPKFQILRKRKVWCDNPLVDIEPNELNSLLAKSLAGCSSRGKHEYSALEILHALALHRLSQCDLCGWDCKINRYRDHGKCGLGIHAHHREGFIHIGEEPVINPAIVFNLGGCALRCCYCIDNDLWEAESLPVSVPEALWTNVSELMSSGIPLNTLEFTNPTESIAGIIQILISAPEDFNLPVVMNCHLYGSETFHDLAGPITDVWLPDLRYGNDQCAKQLSGVDSYMQVAEQGLQMMMHNDAKIIVRILVLPDHLECCHEPAMRLLSKHRETVWLSVLDQYVPEHEAYLDPRLGKRPSRGELQEIGKSLDRYGLRNMTSEPHSVWHPNRIA